MQTPNIGFIGLGKLGLDCAEVFAGAYPVRGYDTQSRHSTTVNICGIHELVRESDWIFVAVPTPHDAGYDGSVPSSHMEPRDFGHEAVFDAIDHINRHAHTAKRVVLISTVLPGTVRRCFAQRLHSRHKLIYNPYLIAMGSVKWDMVNPEMIIIGTEDGDHTALAQQLIDLYQPLMEAQPRYVVGTWEEAESIKIFYNTFISAKISLVNMIQDFAIKIGNINVDVVTNALAQSTMRIMGPKYMTAGMGDAGACHPRDNIALRWLAREYDIGYDLFDTIMRARERQAENLANFMIAQAKIHSLPLAIHGKAYKPDVGFCIGSYSMLVAHYIKQQGLDISYLDPLADDPEDVVVDLRDQPHVILWAHNRKVTYGALDQAGKTVPYCNIPEGSIVIDPWRQMLFSDTYTVIHYGNSRIQEH